MKFTYMALIMAGLSTSVQAALWENAPTAPRGSQSSQLVYNSYSDPLDDTFGQFSGPDVTEFSVARNGSDLDISLSYELPNINTKGLPLLEVVGYVELDVDADSNTGTNQTIYNDYCSPQLAMGADYIIQFPSLGGGPNLMTEKGVPTPMAALLDANFNFISTVPLTLNPNNIEFHVPVNAIGSPAEPIYLSAIMGNDLEPTDCSPDGAMLALDNRGTAATAVPTLSVGMLVLLTLMLAACAIRFRQTA